MISNGNLPHAACTGTWQNAKTSRHNEKVRKAYGNTNNLKVDCDNRT